MLFSLLIFQTEMFQTISLVRSQLLIEMNNIVSSKLTNLYFVYENMINYTDILFKIGLVYYQI